MFIFFLCTFIRFKTLRRRANYQLAKLRSRLHIAEGLLVALRRIGERERKRVKVCACVCVGRRERLCDRVVEEII